MNSPVAPVGHDGPPAARLCTACGICCSGFFFSYAELEPGDDQDRLSAVLPLRQREGKVVFTLRCPALKNRCCSVYDLRPKACRRYRCELLKRVDRDPGTLSQALAIVADAVAIFDRLADALARTGPAPVEGATSAALRPFRRAYAEAQRTSDHAFFERHRELILVWKKAAWVVDQSFDRTVASRLAL